jgi:transposase
VLVERSLIEQRYQAVLEVQAGVPVVDVAERFGVSRQAVHRWKNRHQSGGLEALCLGLLLPAKPRSVSSRA